MSLVFAVFGSPNPGENGTEISVKFHPNFGDTAKYQ